MHQWPYDCRFNGSMFSPWGSYNNRLPIGTSGRERLGQGYGMVWHGVWYGMVRFNFGASDFNLRETMNESLISHRTVSMAISCVPDNAIWGFRNFPPASSRPRAPPSQPNRSRELFISKLVGRTGHGTYMVWSATSTTDGLRALSIYSETGAHWVSGVLRGVQSGLRCVLAHAGDHRAKWLGTGTRMSRVRPVLHYNNL